MPLTPKFFILISNPECNNEISLRLQIIGSQRIKRENILLTNKANISLLANAAAFARLKV